jgi:aldose 1-epimerase
MATFFGKTPSGESVKQVTLSNERGTSINIITLGAIIRSFYVCTSNGEKRDIVLGFDNLDSYLSDEHYLGCVVGRYANRIHKGQFMLDGKMYQSDINQAGNCLHGGGDGFNRRVWQIVSESSHELCLSLVSPDGDQGFPGNLTLTLTYALLEDDTLTIKYQATSDKTTPFNPTQHSYFNLDGGREGGIEEHDLTVMADHILDINESGIPNGKLLPVKDSAFDFNQPKKISQSLRASNPLIKQAQGLDHNWCLNDKPIQPFNASLINARRDLELQVTTTMPGLQVYTGNFLPTHNLGKNGAPCQPHKAVCLESQFYPDSPNHKTFPSSVLLHGEMFTSQTVYKVIAH